MRRALAFALIIAAIVGCADKREETRRALLDLVQRKWADVVALTNADTSWHVAAGVRSRSDLQSVFMEELERQMPDSEIASYEATLKIIGLVPDSLELKRFFIDLFAEQAGGYYDPVRDTLYLLEELPLFFQEGVAVHEITHGLQDHVIDLDSVVYLKGNDDALTAVQSVAEGQATLVMIAEPTKIAIADAGASLSFMAPILEAQILHGPPDPEATEDSPIKMDVVRSAPRYFIKHLLFPYLSGADFVARAYGRSPDAWAIYRDLPVSTEMIIHPEKYLTEPRDLPTVIDAPDFASVLPDHVVKHSNTFGELDVSILVGDEAAAGWDGDRAFYLTKPDGAEPRLVWVLEWDTTPDASEFAAAYADFLVMDHPGASSDGAGRVATSEGAFEIVTRAKRVAVLYNFGGEAGRVAGLVMR